MIQNCSKLRVIDNSGANSVKCFKNLKYQNVTVLSYQKSVLKKEKPDKWYSVRLLLTIL